MIIIGAKGFAKEVLEILIQRESQTEIVFYDDINTDSGNNRLFGDFKILRNENEAYKYLKNKDSRFLIGVGNPIVRQRLFKKFLDIGGLPTTIISPFAQIGHFETSIGEGSIITTGTVITNSVKIGVGSLINLNCTIGHDCTIGDFCEFSPGTHISGNVTIGNLCTLGTGSIVLPKVKIGNNVTVGAGAVVTKDVPDDCVVVGIPAKPLLRNNG